MVTVDVFVVVDLVVRLNLDSVSPPEQSNNLFPGNCHQSGQRTEETKEEAEMDQRHVKFLQWNEHRLLPTQIPSLPALMKRNNHVKGVSTGCAHREEDHTWKTLIFGERSFLSSIQVSV